MIVKLVPSKGTGSFGGLADYLLDSKNNAAKVEDFEFENCPFDTIEDNIKTIKAKQDLNQTAKSDKTMHLIVSFHEEEIPSKEVLKDIETELLKSIGMESHQRLTVTHTNTNNFHMHIAVNKIAPESNKLIEPFRSKIKLSTKAAELEEKHYLQKDQSIGADLPKQDIKIKTGEHHVKYTNLQKPVNRKIRRGRQTTTINNLRKLSEFKLVHDSKRVKMLLHGDALSIVGAKRTTDNRVRLSSESNTSMAESHGGSSRVKDIEIHSGMQNLISWVKAEVLDDIKEVLKDPKSSLEDLHQVLADYNLELKPRGNGIVIADKTRKLFVKASDVHRDLSKGKLEKRFGEFKTSNITTTPKKKFGKPKNELWVKYKELSDFKRTNKNESLTEEREEREAAKLRLKKVFDARLEVVKNSIAMSKKDKYLQRQKIFKERKNANIALSKQFAEKRKDIFSGTKQMSYKDYLVSLALEGDSKALQTLREYSPAPKRDKAFSHPKGKPKHNIFLSLISKITKQGKAVYKLNSGGKITDTGKDLKLSINMNDDDLATTLKMAVAQYGNSIDVGGDNVFKARVLEVNEKYDLKINFSNPSMAKIGEAAIFKQKSIMFKNKLGNVVLKNINDTLKEKETSPKKKSLDTKLKKLCTLYNKTKSNAPLFDGDLNIIGIGEETVKKLDKVEVSVLVDSFINNTSNKPGIKEMNLEIEKSLKDDIESSKNNKMKNTKKQMLEKFKKFKWVLENKDSIKDITVSYYRNRGVDVDTMVDKFNLEISSLEKKIPAVSYSEKNISLLENDLEEIIGEDIKEVKDYIDGKTEDSHLSEIKPIKQLHDRTRGNGIKEISPEGKKIPKKGMER